MILQKKIITLYYYSECFDRQWPVEVASTLHQPVTSTESSKCIIQNSIIYGLSECHASPRPKISKLVMTFVKKKKGVVVVIGYPPFLILTGHEHSLFLLLLGAYDTPHRQEVLSQQSECWSFMVHYLSIIVVS